MKSKGCLCVRLTICTLLMVLVICLSCSCARSCGEWRAVTEHRTDMVSALPELPTLSKCGKCSQGEPRCVGTQWGPAWVRSVCDCPLKGSLEEGRCWLCGSGRGCPVKALTWEGSWDGLSMEVCSHWGQGQAIHSIWGAGTPFCVVAEPLDFGSNVT